MATERKKTGTITKGMKVTVIVEETINDVLVVVLEHGNKVYRGVLLNASTRNLPPGICTAFNSNKTDEFGECTDSTFGNTTLSDNKPVDMSASVFRHTYFPNMPSLGASMPDRAFPKLGSNKPRNIRLRPRQTLCSNCKSTCLESQNGPVPIKTALTTSASYSQLQGIKQQSNVSLSPSKQNLTKSDLKPFKKKSVAADAEPKPTKLIKVHSDSDMSTKLTKSSPYIKISIGETNVMNIPPRIHDLSRQISSDADKSADDDESLETDKGVKSSPYKRMLRRSLDDRNSSDENRSKRNSPNSKQGRTKKVRRRSKDYDESDGDMPPNIIITENVDTSEESEEFVENSENSGDVKSTRPRLVYTWKHNKGLSPMKHSTSSDSLESKKSDSSVELAPRPLENLDGTSLHEPEMKLNKRKKGSVKKYKLRSRSRSLESNPEYEITEDSAYISYEDPKALSDRSDGCSPEDETTSNDDNSDYGDGPPGDDQVEAFKPLMMKIHTHTVSKCSIPDGRKLETGDIVWGKVKGFPWWPGRIMTISVSEKDNSVVIRQIAQVAWFGSKTMSHITCSDLYPFQEDFKLKFDKKKRSTPYRRAIKQATMAAKSFQPTSDIDIDDFDVP